MPIKCCVNATLMGSGLRNTYIKMIYSKINNKKKKSKEIYIVKSEYTLTFFDARYSIPLATQYPKTVRSLEVSAAESSLKL